MTESKVLRELESLGWKSEKVPASPDAPGTAADTYEQVVHMIRRVRDLGGKAAKVTLGSKLYVELGRPDEIDGLPVVTDADFDRVFGPELAAVGEA